MQTDKSSLHTKILLDISVRHPKFNWFFQFIQYISSVVAESTRGQTAIVAG